MKRRHFDLLDHEDEEPHTSGMNGSISENFSTHTGKKKPREKGPMGSRVSPNPRKTERGPVPSLILPDHERRSAFAPYRPSTVLTNLSRGNIQQEVVPEAPAEFCIYQLAGQGELTPDQIAGLDNVDVPDENGSTLLMWASRHGQATTASQLVARGAQVNTAGPNGATPLLLAAAFGHHIIMPTLLTAGGADIDQQDDGGNTALMHACAGNFPKCCRVLLEKDASVFLTNEDGLTAYKIALWKKSHLALKVLESYFLSRLKGNPC